MRKTCAARSFTAALFMPLISSPKATLRSAVSQGNSAGSWKTIPRSSPGSSIRLPLRLTSPSIGFIRPVTMRRNELLPQPEGPSRQRNSLRGIAISKSSSARTQPSWPS